MRLCVSCDATMKVWALALDYYIEFGEFSSLFSVKTEQTQLLQTRRDGSADWLFLVDISNMALMLMDTLAEYYHKFTETPERSKATSNYKIYVTWCCGDCGQRVEACTMYACGVTVSGKIGTSCWEVPTERRDFATPNNIQILTYFLFWSARWLGWL